MREFLLSFLVLSACHDAPGPSRIADSATAIEVAGDRVYWRDEGGSMFVASSTGDNVAAVAPATEGTEGTYCWLDDLHVTAAGVYGFDCANQLLRASSDGAASVLTAPESGFGFAVDDANVYYVGDHGYTLFAQPLEGGAARPLAYAKATFDPIMVPFVYGDQVYFADGSGIWRVGIDGSGEQHLVATQNGGFVTSIAVDALGVFWSSNAPADASNGLGLGTFRANSDGSQLIRIGAPAPLLYGGCPLKIADGRLFWVTDDRRIVSVALDGTDPEVHYAGDRTMSKLVGPAIANGAIYAFASDATQQGNVITGPTTFSLVTVPY